MKNKNYNFIIFIIFSLSFNQNLFAICFDNLPVSNLDSDYIINTDGTVIDKKTNLMWKQCSQGLTGNDCQGNPSTFTWVESLLEAENHGFAGFNDWRVPNIKELRSIVELSCKEPSINENIFPNTRPWYYWTSSPYSRDSNHTWRITFNSGGDFLFGRDGLYFVRLVRTRN